MKKLSAALWAIHDLFSNSQHEVDLEEVYKAGREDGLRAAAEACGSLIDEYEEVLAHMPNDELRKGHYKYRIEGVLQAHTRIKELD